jgi:hypothetical protein
MKLSKTLFVPAVGLVLSADRPQADQRILTELGILSAMWNEHCSYKSSKKWLKRCRPPAQGDPGPRRERRRGRYRRQRGVVFKMESHNHPSFIEPYQGAATGVGGILRDVFTMGARPIAALNALRFGEPDHPKTRHLVSGVVAGIGGYGNSFGVPTVGGEVSSTPRYNGNIPGQRHAAGWPMPTRFSTPKPRASACRWSISAPRPAATASAARPWRRPSSTNRSRKSARPFRSATRSPRKCLLEACLELMADRRGHRHPGHGGGRPHLLRGRDGRQGRSWHRARPRRRAGARRKHDAYEMMLSESQERMLMVLEPRKEEEAKAIFVKWGSTSPLSARPPTICASASCTGEEVANLPIKELGDEAPEYDRPWRGERPAPCRRSISPTS